MSAPFTVPGLISDEALLDYLKTNVRSQKDTTPQPPTNSAVEFADRLGREYIDSPLAKANDRLRSTTSQPTMDAVRSAPRSFSEADVNQTEMRGTLGITPFGGFAQGGKVQKLDDLLFTPEMAQQEADDELKDAQARETAIKDKAATRERLRSMSAEEAAQLGINPEIPVGGQELAQERLRDQSRVTAAEEATAGAQAKSEDTGKQAQQSATFSAIQNAIRTFSQFVPSAAKTAVIYGWEVPRGQLNTEGENASVPRQRLQASEEALNKLFPGDQARKDDFMQQVGAGAGSMAAFLLGGYLLAGAGIGTGTAMAVSGMLASGSEMLEDAERHDGTALQKYISLFVGTGLGATEAIPISRAFMRAEKASGGLVSRMLRETVAQSAEEFLQEFGQAFGTDFLAKMIYDPDRKMDWQQYLENGLVGAILGGAVGGAVGAAGAPKDRTVSDEQRDQAVQAALAGAKRAFDATMVDDVADVALSAVGNETLRKTKPAGTDAEFDLFQGPGGSVPVNERGRLEIRHWSDQQLAEIDPAYRGTGPLYGEERHRLGSRASQDENVVDRAYFGAGNAPTEADMAKLQADLKAAQKKKQRVENPDGTFSYPRDETERAAYARLETLGYRKEGGLGAFLHVAEVDPSVIYNAVEDVRKLKDRVDKALTKSEQLTQFERLVRDEGFEGMYYPQSGLGQTVLMFNKVAPSRTVDERYGLPTTEIATPADFNKPTAETFVKKGGWAVVTATQEALGHHSVQANVEQNEKLEKYLIKNKIPYQRVAGSYQGVDQGPNFMVFMPEDEALKLGKRFKQESILTREGLEYTDGSGRLVPAVPEHTIVGPEAREQDFFSTLPDGTSFTIGLDFGGETATDDDAGDILNKLTTPEKLAQLAETIPGFKGAVKYLTPEEAERVAGRTAQKFVDIFESLPSAHEMAHVAVSGRAKRGWYAGSARAIVEIFGANDAPRFAALLAALSPQTSVEMNTINALRVWTAWVRAGRPKTRKAVRVILGTNVQGDKGENSVLDAWVNNSVEALLTEDPMSIKLSGPKVTAFMNNLRGNVNAVTNDAWMANYALVDQNLFRAAGVKDVAVDGKPRTLGRAGPGYLAMSAVVRKAAEIASDITGDIWSPAEVQETVWSWAKTLYEKAEATGVSAEELIDAGQLSADEIANTPDFASLFAGGVYGEILKEGGYDVGTIGSSTGADRGDAGRSSPVSSEGTAADQRAFEIYLRDAARRLDALRERRAGEKGGAKNSAAEDLEIDAEGTTLGLPDEDYDAILNTFGSLGAKNVDTASLDAARDLYWKGAAPRDIWEETGWFRGLDGVWRFEIRDADASFTDDMVHSSYGSTRKLGQVLKHDKLFSAYPFLKDLVVTLSRDEEVSGYFRPDTMSIAAKAPSRDRLMPVLLHEIQHAIQQVEGLAKGGNLHLGELYEGPTVDAWRNRLDEARALHKKGAVSDEVLKLWEEGYRRAAAYEYYRRIAGEVESRNVERRYEYAMASPPGDPVEDGPEPFPEDTQDVSSDDVIIVYAPGGQAFHEVNNSVPEPLPDGVINSSATRGSGGGTSNRRARFRGERGRPEQGVPVDPAQAEAVDPATASLRQITDHFVKALELTVRQGRLTKTGKGDAAGQYNIRTGVIRVENTSDLSTVVHEGAHAIERQAGPALRKFVDDRLEEFKNAADKLYGSGVTTTAMLNNDVHKAEGFAEFFRVYVLNPRYTEKHFTKLYDDFNQFLESNDPRLLQQLRIIGAEFEAYTKMSSVDVMRGMVVTARKDSGFVAAMRELQQTGFSTWMQEVTRASIRDMANKYAPLNQIVAQALNLGEVNQGKAIDLKMAEDPRVLIRLAANSGSRAMTQITDGVLGYQSVNPISRGLREALLRYHGLGASDNLPMVDPVREADFSTYITALRAKDEYRRYSEGKIPNPPIGLLEGDVDQAITDLDRKYGEDFSEAAAIVHEYAMALWERMHDAGLLTDESYTEGLDRQFYVPLIRDMTDVKGERGRDGGKATGGDPAKLVKRFKGSDRPVIDPFATLMQKTFALEKVIAENDVKRALARLSDRVGTAGALIERIPAHRIIGRNLDLKELARDIVKASDLSADEATELMTLLEAPMDNGVSISIFERLQALAGNDNVVFFWEKGRVAAIQLQDGDVGLDIMNVLNGVGREAAPWYVDLVAWTSSTFRSSITLWPDFLIVNFIRDQFSTFILNENYVPFVTGLRGVGEELRQSQWAKQYNASMAVMGGMNVATLHQARVQNDIRVLRSKGYLAKIFSQEEGLKRFMKGFASFTELTETGTRMGLYRATFERAKADGLTDYEASVEAAYRATDTMDFGLHGSRLTTARRLIPFLNAQIQGLYKMMRTLGADEVRQRKGLTFALSAYFKDVNRLELSRTERAAIRTGRKAWIKMASLAVVSAALALLYEDDPDYQETSEYMRQTGWVIPYGDGRIAYIPKPFELALLANFTERAIEYGSGDPTSKDRFLRGLAMTLTPPTAPPAAQTLVEQLANYDFFSGREIVPDYMQALAGEQQYSNYTSEMAKQIAKITGWSAMRIDHVLSGLGASAYRDVSTMTNQLNPNRPDLGWTDTPIVRRFIRDARRGSTSGQDFWKYASTTTGLLTRASRTYRNYIDQGNDRAANEFLESLSEDEQAFALLDTHFKADAKRINPFYRNRQIATIVSAMRREISSDLGLEDTDKLADSPTIRMTGREKRDASEALMELARRETRNTLVYSQTPGWDSKKPLDVETTMDVLEQIDPRVRAELDRRLKKANVYSADFVREYWPEVKNRLLADRENSFLKDIVKAAQ